MFKCSVAVITSLLLSLNSFSQAVTVDLIQVDDQWVLRRDGEPYFIEGAGGSDFLGRLSGYGGNSIRTWGTDEQTLTLLDSAHSLGLTVCMGLWVGHQEHGFDYQDENAIARQLENFRNWVETYKNHPAVLLWGIGNEVELGVSYNNLNLQVWNAINDISEMIHEVDGNHPTLTVTAGISDQKLQDIKERAPSLDILGVNCYGCIGSVPDVIDDGDWNKPYIITEWGPNGQWESPSTPWGATYELTSTEKAELYFGRYLDPILNDKDKSIGSYVFLWSSKFEETPTWYGLFFQGFETEAVDVMTYHWSGAYPVNRAPQILSATLNKKTRNSDITIREDEQFEIILEVADEDIASLKHEFLIQPEEGSSGTVSDHSHSLDYLPGLLVKQEGPIATFTTPPNRENYRLFYFVRDNDENIALGNIPFRVELNPLVSSDPEVLFPLKDAYVRDGPYADIEHGAYDMENLLVRGAVDPDRGFNREAFVQFDISSIDEDMNVAVFELYGGETENVRAVVYSLGGIAWNENRLNWDTKFGDTTYIPLDTSIITADKTYHTWNILEHVRQARINEEEVITLAVRNLDYYQAPTYWSSRETRPNPPRIRLEYNGGQLALNFDRTYQTNIYPNPVARTLNIRSANKLQQIQLIDLSGKVLMTNRSIIKKDVHIDVSSLKSGIYQINLLSSSKIETHKFVKQ